MLSYRHGFHAGNHADVLKHAALVFLLDYLSRKDKPWWFVDTHAGAAQYDLHSEWAQKNGEHDNGITRLWREPDLPPALAGYVAHVRRLNPDGQLRIYPGSPQLARQCARADDRLRLFELHGTESAVLQRHFAADKAHVQVKPGDGYSGLASVLPPPPRRGLVLIDPSYEERTDYTRVAAAFKESLKRFASGIYMVWYPRIQRREAHELPAALERLAGAAQADWLNASLDVTTPSADGFGMHGSGIFVFNPPYTMPAMLNSALPYLQKRLGLDAGASTALRHKIG
jgi:23S rRNA (adenine2030-N6)-methyltransferase